MSFLAQLGNWLLSLFVEDEAKQPIWTQLNRFFGRGLQQLESHEKLYPGYDLASLNRALASFHQEACTTHRVMGACSAQTIRQFFELCKTNQYYCTLRPSPPTFQRVPVDVEEEISVVSNSLYLATMRSEAGRHLQKPTAAVENGTAPTPPVPEKIAVILAITSNYPEYWEGMETNRVAQQQVTVSIACRNRDAANRFFAELEERRKKLSVFRGKVIDPMLSGGIVHAIGFRAIKRVREDDLVLPDSIKQLVQHSIVGFYNHQKLLETLGIDMKRGVLLHGPPGTGKTSISLYLAGLLPSFTVCFVSGERLLYPREICRMARYLQPAMVVFEDIDLIAQARDANGLATVLGELMNQIDGCEPTDQVLFLMNTNSLERLESAVRNRPGRVDQIIEIPLPDRPARELLIRSFARNVKIAVNDYEKVLQATEGMTPAMLKEIVKRSAVSAIGRNGRPDGAVTLEEADLLLAAEQAQAMREPIAPGKLGFRKAAP